MKLFIATPYYGTPLPLYVESMMRLAAARPIEFVHRMQPACSVRKGRNKCVHEFLKTDCTDILFVDADMGFSDKNIERICSHDLDVVGGVYLMKQKKVVAVLSPEDGENIDANGLQKVKGIGTGFLRIRREVFERAKQYTKSYRTSEGEREFMFFHEDIENDMDWGEDLYFCNRYRENGGTIYADWGCRLQHQGYYVWSLEPQTHKEET